MSAHGELLLEVVFPGEPVGKGRPRVALHGGKARAYTPAKTKAWEAHAGLVLKDHLRVHPELRDALLGSGPLAVEIEAVKARRRADKGRGRIVRTVKPDLDNVIKIVLDAVVKAGVITDDALVARLEASQWHAAVGEGAHTRLRIRTLREAEWIPLNFYQEPTLGF